MRKFIYTALFSILMLPNIAMAQAGKVQDIIAAQLQAFMSDDFKGAFEFAAPNIQMMFQSPDNFELMVKNGYPMVHRHRSVVFGEYNELPNSSSQVVSLEALDGSVYRLRYDLVETGGEWRIMGVLILSRSATGV